MKQATALLVGKRPDQNHDEVDEDPDPAEAAKGQDHEDPGAGLSDVEAVDAQESEEETQQQRDEPGLGRGIRGFHSSPPIGRAAGPHGDAHYWFMLSRNYLFVLLSLILLMRNSIASTGFSSFRNLRRIHTR